MPLSGRFMHIEGVVLVHQTEKNDAVCSIMTHGDKGRFLLPIFTPPLHSTKSF